MLKLSIPPDEYRYAMLCLRIGSAMDRLAKQQQVFLKKTEQSMRNLTEYRRRKIGPFPEEAEQRYKAAVWRLQGNKKEARLLLRRLREGRSRFRTKTFGEYVKEFGDYARIPSVTAVSLENEFLVICLEGALQHEEVIYDLGDWVIRVNLNTFDFTADNVRSGRIDNRKDAGLQYEYGGFCYGANKPLLETLMLEGSFYDAVVLAAAYMNQVNDEHLNVMHRVYHAREESEK